MSARALARPGAVVLLALAVWGCTESDDVTRDVGVIRVFPTARQSNDAADRTKPGLQLQYFADAGYVIDGDPGIQSALITLTEAVLDIDGNAIDLLLGDDTCVVHQSSVNVAVDGNCSGGLVVRSRSTPVTGTLTVRATIELRRVEPLVLQPMDDFDLDGVANSTDNCPLVSNADQQEGDVMGVGAACTAVSLATGLPDRDSDQSLVDPLDTITDDVDNCVYFPNQTQVDTREDGDLIADTIGDACPVQRADVEFAGSVRASSVLPVPAIEQAPLTTGFVIVDFGAAGTVIDCDWVLQKCTLVPGNVQACFSTSVGPIGVGCD